MFEKLFAQRIAVQAQPLGGARLVLVGLRHHRFQQRFFHRADQHVVHAVGLNAPQVLEITLQAGAYALFNVLLAHAASSIMSIPLELAAIA